MLKNQLTLKSRSESTHYEHDFVIFYREFHNTSSETCVNSINTSFLIEQNNLFRIFYKNKIRNLNIKT